MSFNKLILVGNLGGDVDLRYTPQGHAVASVSIATNEKRNGEEKTVWFKVTLWRERAESFAKYFKKGDTVYIDGKLSQSEWTDRDGNTRTTLEVDASNWEFVGAKQE